MKMIKPWFWPKLMVLAQLFRLKKIVNSLSFTINKFTNNVIISDDRLKRFRKVFTRYDKLDSIFISTISFAFIFDSLFM